MLKKVNEKKVLHKVKKQWVVLGTALFVLGTAGAYSESVHADTVVGDNHSSSTAVVTSSAATTTSQSADGVSSVATSKDASATSSGATSGSSTGTSSSASASQPATTTLQTDNIGQSSAVYTTEDQDGISLRDGENTPSSVNVSFASSMPSYSGITPIQVNFIYSNENSLTSSSAWIAGDNVSNGDTFSIDVPQNVNDYCFTGANSTIGSESVSKTGTSDNPKYILTGKFDSYSDISSAAVTLHYGIPASASVNYVYSNAGKVYTETQTLFNTYAGDSLSTQSYIDSLTAKGYKLSKSTPSLSSNTIILSGGSNNYELDFDHITANYDQNNSSYPNTFTKDDFTKTFNRTINFVDSTTNSSISSSVTQSVTYNRSGVYDEVTKSMSYGAWTASDNSSFAEQAAPSVADYENPQPASVSAQSVDAPNADGSDTTSASTSVNVKYTKSSAAMLSGTVSFLDTDNNNSTVTTGSFSGPVGAAVDYSSTVDSLSSQGYQLITSDSPATSFTVKSSDNSYVFKLAHKKDTYSASNSSFPTGLSKDNFSKSFTRTINFIDADTKQPISSAATQTVSYNRSAVYDEVTKSTSFSSWSTSDSSFDEYSAPSIAGYKSPQPTSISASSVDTPDASGSDGTNASTSATISYTKAPSTSSSTTYTPYVAPKPASSSAVAGSDAPLIFYSASSSATSSSAPTTTSSSSVASSSVASNAVPSSVPSSNNSSVATGTIKMYNYKTELVKSNDQILIFIQPKYAPNDANGSLSNQFMVNQTLDNGQISHDQQVTLDQYNSMLVASGKQPYTPETLNQAYIDRNDYKGILKNNEYKTTFDADVVKQGNDVRINTNTQTNGFNKPADNRLVSINEVSRTNTNGSDKKKTDKSKDKSKVKNKSKAKKQSAKKAKRAQKHVKKQAKEHNVTKHTHHVKHDRKQK